MASNGELTTNGYPPPVESRALHVPDLTELAEGKVWVQLIIFKAPRLQV